MLVKFSTLKNCIAREERLTKEGLQSVNTKFGIPYNIIKLSSNIVTRCVDVSFIVINVRESFESRSINVATCWLLDAVHRNDTKVLMMTDSSGPAAEIS